MLFRSKLSVIGFKLDKARCDGGTYPGKGEGGREFLAFVESYEKAIRSGVSEKNWSRYGKYCEFVREEFNRPTVCGDLVALPAENFEAEAVKHESLADLGNAPRLVEHQAVRFEARCSDVGEIVGGDIHTPLQHTLCLQAKHERVIHAR